jgi:ABC-type uncharacterized transport system substrate-binding protein
MVEAYCRFVTANAVTDHWNMVQDIRVPGRNNPVGVDDVLETEGEFKGCVSEDGYAILSKVKSTPFEISESEENSEWSWKKVKTLTSKAGLSILEKIADNVDFERVAVVDQMKKQRGN